jgi:hypothetical protein
MERIKGSFPPFPLFSCNKWDKAVFLSLLSRHNWYKRVFFPLFSCDKWDKAVFLSLLSRHNWYKRVFFPLFSLFIGDNEDKNGTLFPIFPS